MKKFLVKYTLVEPYMDWDNVNWKDVKEPEEKERLFPYKRICVLAENDVAAKDQVEHNFLYSYADYNRVDEVIEITDDTIKALKGFDRKEVDKPVNPDGNVDWKIDRRKTFF